MSKKSLSSFLLVSILFFNNNYAQVSPKRGITYGKHSDVDLNVLKSGISWWYIIGL